MDKSRNNIDISHITTYQVGMAQSTMHRNTQKISNNILKPYGITKMQWIIIGAVLDAGKDGIRMSDLAKNAGVTIPYLTNTIQNKEMNEYIELKANDKDARSKLLFVKSDKIERCAVIETELRKGLRGAIYSRIDRDDFKVYLEVLLSLKDIR